MLSFLLYVLTFLLIVGTIWLQRSISSKMESLDRIEVLRLRMKTINFIDFVQNEGLPDEPLPEWVDSSIMARVRLVNLFKHVDKIRIRAKELTTHSKVIDTIKVILKVFLRFVEYSRKRLRFIVYLSVKQMIKRLITKEETRNGCKEVREW